MSPSQGPPGTSVNATASGLLQNDTVQLIFNGEQVDSAQADSNRSITFSFNVPNLSTGTYQVTVTGREHGSASASF